MASNCHPQLTMAIVQRHARANAHRPHSTHRRSRWLPGAEAVHRTPTRTASRTEGREAIPVVGLHVALEVRVEIHDDQFVAGDELRQHVHHQQPDLEPLVRFLRGTPRQMGQGHKTTDTSRPDAAPKATKMPENNKNTAIRKWHKVERGLALGSAPGPIKKGGGGAPEGP